MQGSLGGPSKQQAVLPQQLHVHRRGLVGAQGLGKALGQAGKAALA